MLAFVRELECCVRHGMVLVEVQVMRDAAFWPFCGSCGNRGADAAVQ